MTKPALATQAQICRAIRAVQKAGLRVKGISPDGTVLIDSGDIVPEAKPEEMKWRDDESEQ